MANAKSWRDALLLAGRNPLSTGGSNPGECPPIGETCVVHNNPPLRPPAPPPPVPPPDQGDGGGGGGESGGGQGDGHVVRCLTLLSAADRVSRSFMVDREEYRFDPYDLPGKADSGVTIATGVDLAKWTLANLQSAGVSRDTRLELVPFLATGHGQNGPEGARATAALNASGLRYHQFPAADIVALDGMAHSFVLGRINAWYNSGNRFGATFGQLPESVQTAVFSLFFNIGPYVAAPIFKGHIMAGRFAQAAAELKYGFGGDPNRRALEAELLETAITSGQLPADATAGRC